MTPELKCGSCRACCLIEQGPMLHPEAGDDPALYETVTRPDGMIQIAPREKGRGCRYLGPKGCTIYDTRPAECRAFDCRNLVLRDLRGANREWRRRAIKVSAYGPIYKAGIDRLRVTT